MIIKLNEWTSNISDLRLDASGLSRTISRPDLIVDWMNVRSRLLPELQFQTPLKRPEAKAATPSGVKETAKLSLMAFIQPEFEIKFAFADRSFLLAPYGRPNENSWPLFVALGAFAVGSSAYVIAKLVKAIINRGKK